MAKKLDKSKATIKRVLKKSEKIKILVPAKMVIG